MQRDHLFSPWEINTLFQMQLPVCRCILEVKYCWERRRTDVDLVQLTVYRTWKLVGWRYLTKSICITHVYWTLGIRLMEEAIAQLIEISNLNTVLHGRGGALPLDISRLSFRLRVAFDRDSGMRFLHRYEKI